MAGNTGWDDIMAQLNAVSQGGGQASTTGPTAASALGGSFVNGKVPMVYWGQSAAVTHKNTSGRDSSSQEEGDRKLGIGNRAQDSTMTVQNAVADWYSWTDAERSAFGQRLYKLGLVNNPTDYGSVFQQWQNAVQESSNFYSFANKKVTPWQVLDIVSGSTHGGPQPTTQTQKSFKIPTVEDAHAATKQIFQSLMGRDPDKNELDRYASMMTGYAQKHPTITKMTTDAHGNQTTSSTGGVSDAAMGDMLGNQAKADPEYGSFQAASTYWNALLGAMGGSGNG